MNDIMSFTEDCEMHLNQLGIDTSKLSNKKIRELYSEVTGDYVEW